MSNLNDATSQILQHNADQVSAQIDSSYSALVVNATKTRLPEHVFVSFFLPFFSGELEHPALVGRNPLTDWISIAGTPMAEVDITDVSNNTVFTIPSLFDTNIIDIINRKPGNALSDLYSQYDMRSNVPSAANNYLANALYNKSMDITQNVNSLLSSKNRWEAILVRYGKIADGMSTNKLSQVDPSDDVIYE